MTDTDKCPRCGKELIWSQWSTPMFGWCPDVDNCGYRAEKDRDDEVMIAAAMHRIRELEHESRNARLIAAAPEMAELLEEIVHDGWAADYVNTKHDTCPVCRARALLKRIKGGE